MDSQKLIIENEELKIPDFKSIGFELDAGISLRRFIGTDAEIVFETVKRNADHLMEFMHWMVPDYSLDMAREFIERSNSAAHANESLGFGIFRGPSLIGSIGFVHFDWKAKKTEIGYWIDRAEQGKGIVWAACKRLMEWVFDDLAFNRIEIRCSAENLRSAAIPQRFGFKLEGHLRQAEMRNGKLHDFLIYGLLASEWSAANAER